MKVNRVFLVATVAAMVAVTVPSCMYPPQYSGSSYSSGYGYGYGNRGFSTVHFVRTSNSRWGYDPYTRCYYDYTRRCYYDPYLNGYYPVGYRPVYVHGTPHPHGWRTGNPYIAPPRYIHNHNLNNYQDRSDRYRSLNTDWSRNIKPTTSSRSYDSNRDHYNHYDRNSNSSQNRQSGNGSFFGTSLGNQRSHADNRNQNAYINNTQEHRHVEPRMSEPRMSEPKQESPKSSGNGRGKKEDGGSPSNHESKPKKERGGNNKKQDDHSEAMLRLADRDSNRVKI
jgi:hypothetical protein